MRRAARLAAFLAGGNLALAASVQEPAAAAGPTAEELAVLGLASTRAWEITGNLRTAIGAKENLLLSAVHPEDSPFVQAEAELFWWLPPTERFEALAFTNATFTRFTASDQNPREWQAFAHAEARWFARRGVQIAVVTEGYHLDQVFDLSASDAERLTARLGVTGGQIATPWRWDFLPGTWVELRPAVQRDHYRDGSDDNAQHLVRATVGRSFLSDRIEAAVSAQALRRNYKFRPQYTAAGRPLTGTDLAFVQREGEARVSATWGEARRWHTSTAVNVATNDDNGSGYFNYHQRSLRQEVSWTRAPWKLRLTGRAGRYDYDVQTQGIGVNPPRRRKDEHVAQSRIEHQWTKRVLVYADFSWERSRSNDPLASYRVRTTSAGVDWSF